ncbi:hypothetical protein EKP34_08830 [Campylobacter upsaliensis]|nr:hypothetical protein [Campylobacter upsaliensis]EAI2137740.1 hypothetical protein [Campylobacter upsaliensis]EHQ1324280.1 hypothetical protein [Campylobacter upsaliensis]EJC0919782.1 hypothetical protein [Campylobacter upsaliensis]
MWEKKHENSKIRSFRIPQIIDDFFKNTFIKNQSASITANDFLLDLIKSSQEYKDYLRKKAEQDNKNQPSLF